MMDKVYDETRDHPLMTPYHDHWRQAVDILVEAWPLIGHEKDLLHAAFSLALDFNTWRMLVRVNNLDDDQVVELMLRLTCDCTPDAG